MLALGPAATAASPSLARNSGSLIAPGMTTPGTSGTVMMTCAKSAYSLSTSAVLSSRTLPARENSRSASPIQATSPALGSRCPMRSGGFLAVLLVSDKLAPGHDAAGLIGLLHHQVGHDAVRRCAMPVFLAGLEEDVIAGPNLLD